MSNEQVKQEVRGHMRIFAVVLVLAIASAVISMASDAPIVPLVMIVAAVQGGLILAFLMHLKHEGKAVQWLIAVSAFFLIALFGLTFLAKVDTLTGTETIEPSAPAESVGEDH